MATAMAARQALRARELDLLVEIRAPVAEVRRALETLEQISADLAKLRGSAR
jgi:hypothetical protein